jgi:hypothetical protein
VDSLLCVVPCLHRHALRVAGMLLMLFEPKRHIFTNVLYGAADEHFSWDFYPHKLGRINTSILGVEFIDIQADRAIGKAQGVESGGVSH